MDRHPPSPAVRLARAVRLHCPECGSGGILASWFRLRAMCPRCHLLLERGARDFFLGAYMISLLVGEALFAGAFSVALILTWPNPPWDALQWGAAVMAVLAPIAIYPFTKTVWLACDLIFQPPTDQDRPAG